jgi:hypothetical protein
MANDCVCAITVGEVYDGLCLRCRRPTDRRPTAAFVPLSAPPSAGPLEASRPGHIGRDELLSEFERVKREAGAKRRMYEDEARRRFKNR